MQPAFLRSQIFVIGFSLLICNLDSDADSCVKYHKLAPVKAVCGHVINPLGEKLNAVEFNLIDEKGNVRFTTKSDKNGAFRFKSIPRGDYMLRATAPGYMYTQREIRVIRDNVERCSPKVEVTLGTGVCSTGTYVKGVDKPSDLDAGFRNGQE